MNRTDQTLIEQMQISDIEINNRKELLNLTSDDLNVLTCHKLLIEENLDDIVDVFYQQQTQVDEIALLIGDADTLMRLQTALRKYILDMFSGYCDTEYVNNRLRIGLVHKRIGVEPKLYLSAVRTLKKVINDKLASLISDEKLLQDTLESLDKLFYFDTTLVFDTYIGSLVGEIETAKKRTEIYAQSLEEKVAERTKQLEELSRIDHLTGIYNQRAMYDYLRRELASAKRAKTKISIIYFDVDKFKQINDQEGHAKGDEVLKKIGQILQNNDRENDIPCRYGGDEFALILPNCDIENAKVVCEKIIKDFNAKYLKYHLSFGIAQTGSDSYVDGDVLIKMADEKMYLAKQEGGCQIRF